jgi:PHD/YefM family antitoxin component YafN of YafNO toxin-antitoxin module
LLADAYLNGPEEVIINAQEYARKAIREKVLESYRNGQAAGPRKNLCAETRMEQTVAVAN